MGLTSVYRKRANDDLTTAADPILWIDDRQTLINPGRFDKAWDAAAAEPAITGWRNFIHERLTDRLQAIPAKKQPGQTTRLFKITSNRAAIHGWLPPQTSKRWFQATLQNCLARSPWPCDLLRLSDRIRTSRTLCMPCGDFTPECFSTSALSFSKDFFARACDGGKPVRELICGGGDHLESFFSVVLTSSILTMVEFFPALPLQD